MYFTLTISFLVLLIYLNKDTFNHLKNKKNKINKKIKQKKIFNTFNNHSKSTEKIYHYCGVIKNKTICETEQLYKHNIEIELTLNDKKYNGYKKKKLLCISSRTIYDLYSIGDKVNFEEINKLDKKGKVNKNYISKNPGFIGVNYKTIDMDLILNREELMKIRQYKK